MQRSTLTVLALAAGLLGCTTEPRPATGEFSRVTATIDGRPYHADGGAFHPQVDGESATITTSGSTLSVIARRTTGFCEEIVQVQLTEFDGVGAYTLYDYLDPGHRGWAAYACHGAATYWSDNPLGRKDTAWVTAYDSVSKHIEGRFRFLGMTDNDSVVVDEGTFSGTVGEYQP